MEKLEENKGGSRYKGCTFFPVVVVFIVRYNQAFCWLFINIHERLCA